MDTYDDVPFDALTYLTAECNYGGRVTDNLDRRLIISLLSKYYTPQVISSSGEKYRLCESSETYFVPPTPTLPATYDDFVEYIRQLPLVAQPEVFGLNENANITRDNQETQELFDGILLTLPREVIRQLLYHLLTSNYHSILK